MSEFSRSSMGSMHITHIIDHLGLGGAQQLLITFGRCAARRGIRTTVISLGDKDHFRRQLEQLGVQVLMVPPARKMVNPVRMIRLLRYLGQVAPDLVNTHLQQGNVLGGIAARMRGIPVVGTIHGFVSRNRISDGIKRRLELAVLRRCMGEIITVSRKDSDMLKKIMSAKPVVTIANTVDLQNGELDEKTRFELRRELVGDPHRPILISVGRLAPEKGFQDLLKAFRRVVSEYCPAYLLIVGDGPLRRELQDVAAAADLSGDVCFMGVRDDVPRLLAAADVYVCASHRDAFPIAVLEAMAGGLPVVATDVGDLREVVQPDTGLMVKAGAISELAEAIG